MAESKKKDEGIKVVKAIDLPKNSKEKKRRQGKK